MRLTRRQTLVGFGGAITAGAAARLAAADPPAAAGARAFVGGRQPGILGARQDHLTLAAFDLRTPDRADLRRLLADWTALVVTLCEGRPRGAHDTGEADELGTSALSVTVGFGASLFDDRYGLRARLPAGLGGGGLHPGDERLDAGGDLLVQVCGDDRQVVFHATHQLANAALGIASQRWTQHGFLSRPRPDATPRNLFGFQDGTANIETTDASALAGHVWTPEPGLAGGTYLVYRRVRMRFQAWDRAALEEQERSIGRRKRDGEPLGPAVPQRSHVAAMRPDANGGIRILRRSYNYDDGPTADGEPDAGVAFVAFAADPARQVAPLLARMEHTDDLRRYLVPTRVGVFAIPPAPPHGEPIGAGLVV